MNKTITSFRNQLSSVLSLLFLVSAMVFFSSSVSAQEIKKEEVKAPVQNIRPVPPIVSTSNPVNTDIPVVEKNKSGFFDNGYIRYALTGDAAKDAELYRVEKEKLFADHPDLYKKWVGGTTAAPQENNGTKTNRVHTKD